MVGNVLHIVFCIVLKRYVRIICAAPYLLFCYCFCVCKELITMNIERCTTTRCVSAPEASAVHASSNAVHTLLYIVDVLCENHGHYIHIV
jgi:hypothetical protein